MIQAAGGSRQRVGATPTESKAADSTPQNKNSSYHASIVAWNVQAPTLQLLLIERHDALHAKVVVGLGSAMNRHVDADDILQDAYAKAFRTVTECSFEDPRAFHAWLEGIVMNTLRDQHRFLRRKKRDIRRGA